MVGENFRTVTLAGAKREIWLIGSIAIIDALLLVTSNFSIDWTSELPAAAAAIILAGLFLVYWKLRPTPRLAALLSDTLRLLLFTNVAGVLSYQLTGLIHLPLMDGLFDGADNALGLNWLAYDHWMRGRPLILLMAQFAYKCAMLQLVVLLCVLALLQQRQQAQELFYGFAWSGLAVIVIGALLPASGASVHYHLGGAHTRPEVVQYLALRDGSLRVIDLRKIQGLVWFPSFHAALAGLYVYTSRKLPKLFWPLLLLNLVMLAACPVLGGHYGVDLLAGLLVLAAVLVIQHRLSRSAAHTPP